MQTLKTPLLAAMSKNERLVSFENSNSFLKRHDDEGTLVIQAGYRLNPTDQAFRDDENPVLIAGGSARWYGAIACSGSHVRSYELSKIETARDHFAACLRPSDDGKDLTVIAAHWEAKEFDKLQSQLKGTYDVIRNGHSICCNVKKVIPVLEGTGSFNLVRNRLQSGHTLLIEMGFVTCETWIFDEQGRVIDGRAVSQLGIINLAKTIADDPSVKAALSSNGATSINLSLVSAALKQSTLGRIKADQWDAIKTKHVNDFLRTFKGYLVSQFESQSQLIVNTVLTGGGSALLQSVQPKINGLFVIPDEPQTASVRGSYLFYSSQLKQGS